MATERYFRPVRGTSDSIRIVVTKDEQHNIVAYTVQLEIYHEERYYPAVRFDAAHGQPHRDTLDWDGHVVAKDWLRPLGHAAALTEAEKDILANWRKYREEFFWRKP